MPEYEKDRGILGDLSFYIERKHYGMSPNYDQPRIIRACTLTRDKSQVNLTDINKNLKVNMI